MIGQIFRIVIYIRSIIEVYGELKVISSSFQGNTFADADNWVVSGGQEVYTECMGIRLFGGYKAFGTRISLSKSFSLPPHAQINLDVQFWKIDSWDSEYGYVFVDYQIGWQKRYQYYEGTQMCGGGGDWREAYINLNLKIKHSGNTAVVVITTNLDEGPENESWGIRDFTLSVEMCPEGCLICQLNDSIMDCYQWKIIQSSWTQMNMNEIVQDGWNVISGIAEATQCGSVALFGGYKKTGTKTVISNTFYNIPPHYKLKIQILWAKIDSWDNEAAQMRVDNVLLWERKFQWYEGYSGKICGSSYSQHRTIFVRNDQDLVHTNNQVEIKFQTTLDEPTDGESFGLRDFVLFYGSCTENCDQCTGPSGSECQMCSKGCYNTGVEDKICQLCYPSCYLCDGPSIEDCTDCGDPNIYHKQLVAGQCLCAIRTIEQVQSDGITLCLPCHSKCEKCYQPFDNTSNQYCTMCKTGLNRIVSDELNCVCKPGYGDDGISEICVQCHYTCENCKGSLATDCTSCSIESQRHLTSDNQCLCNKAYIDTGINDIQCLYICHSSCSDCDVSGEDKCTSCPMTRQPDRIGTTFKCVCKDSHYFSDDIHLECLPCHFTCKTCNGIYENNCLTCDLSLRQLVMFKCICPNGYYDIGLLQCSPCYYTCLTCFGPEEDNCLTCLMSNNREVKANKCLCIDTYMEKQSGDPQCYKCSYRCANCIGTIDNCTSCPSFSFRDLGTNNSCSCPAKSYDEPENPICIICHNTCLTCNGNQQNQCTSCNGQIMRQLDSLGQCLCMSKYYDAGQPECKACSTYCQNCKNSADYCISCKSDRYLQDNICICKTKLNGAMTSSYQVQGKIECASCHYSCLTCDGTTASKCTSCLDSEMRVLENGSCICPTHYLDTGKPKCLQCNYRCENCVGTDTNCLSCYQNSFRNLINQQCKCQKGYYDDGQNIICQKCHYSCSECSSIGTKCDGCSLTSNRQFNSQLFTCNCQENYYDSGVETCSQCHYSCLGCNGQGKDQCKSCLEKSISFRVLNSGVCQCLNGYYDDGSSTICKNCQIQCLTCQNKGDYCTSCPTTRHLDGNTCICDQGYYDNKGEKCLKCDQNCVNCSISSKNCSECDLTLKRILDQVTHRCICKDGSTELNGICVNCDITCQTCQNQINYCTSCKTLRLLINNKCQCINGTYESGNDKQCLYCNATCLTCINQENYCTSCAADKYRIFKTGNICICQDGYYEDLVTFNCKICDLSCLTCKVSATFCLSCDSQYNLSLNNQNRCICSSGFYFNTSSLKCEACNIQCKECKTLSQCLECEISTRYYDADNFKCPCKDGYYDTNLKKCQLCNITCKTCVNQSTQCLSCEPIYFRVLNNNQCLCQDGYYDIGIEMCQLCNKLCKTCQMTSIKCLSCFETQQFRYLNINQCICQNGYYDNGQTICEKCSNQCQTCQGKRDYCTSCDINQNRIDQSVIKKCPCLSGFYQDNDENCQKCHLSCSTCQQQNNNCISCATSITSNRLAISKNCICKDGYYDDGTQVDCQKCSLRCKLCQKTSTNCLSCSINLREIPPICNCKQGFYEDSLQNCQLCENQCTTCQDNASNCLTCKEGRFTQKCLCQDGYFEGGQPLCQQCGFQCETCKDSSLNCLICKGDRINSPKCICPDGFYDDFMNQSCQICDSLCYTCNLDGCLICNGNRILSSEMICDQPPDSIPHNHTPWCSTCEVAVMEIRFSDNLLSILVKFDFPLDQKFFITQFQDNICLKILHDQTYKLLGKNPTCYIDQNDNTILIIKIGQQVTILPGDKILFYENSFSHLECDKKLTIFIFNEIKPPINPVSPIINYDLPTYLLNPCDDNTISLKSKYNDGLRGLNGIIWTFSVDGSNGDGNLQNFVNFQNNQQMLELIIPFSTLPKQSNITLYLEFQNFVAQKTRQIIKLYTHSGQFPTILWISKPQYYSFETVVLEFQIKKKDCSESTTTTTNQIDNSQYQVSIVEVYRNDSSSRPSRVNHSEITSNSIFNVTIQNYTLTSRVAYTFQQTTLDILMNFSIIRNITLEISSGGILCQFNGTKKIQNYRKETQIFISCKDLDTQYAWNEDNAISIQVSCLDLTMNTRCIDLNKKLLQINKTDSVQTIPKQTIQPYTIQSWQVVASKKQYSYTFKQNIVFLDNDFKLLDVSYKQGYKMRPINNYENLEFIINIPFEDRQYILEFQVAIIYNFELIKILQSEYFSFQFRIFDYFQEFNRGNQINLKFLAQFTNEIVPSQDDLQLVVNLPPTCIVSLGQQSVEALQPQNIITICDFSENAPFIYQLRYFLTNQDFIDFQNRTSDYSLILNDFQKSNTFEGYFPFADGVILVSAMDSKGSYLNIDKHINVTKTQLNCSGININNYNFKYQISLFLEILLNHLDLIECTSLSKQLYSNIKTYLGAEDINNQLLVYQTTKLYKRLIQNQNDTNSQRRLLKDNSLDRCFENSTQQIYYQIQKINNGSTYTPTNLQTELKQIKSVAQKLIQKSTDFLDLIKSNEIFQDEQLYQQKEAVLNSLQVLLLLIDDIFVKIQTTLIVSNQDKQQIMSISIDLITLIEKIANQVSIQAQVNGQQLIINGQILKWQLSKITKVLFNSQFEISNDVLDGLIDFVQKEQVDLNYNHLNLSEKLQIELQTLFNLNSTLEIDERIYKKVNLKNHLYNNHYIEYQNTLKKYIIDMFQLQYCQDQISQQYLYTYECVNINNDGKYFKCDLLNEKINNTTLLVSCQCEQLGSILLIRYQDNSTIQQNVTSVTQYNPIIDNSDLQLSENPILLFYAIYISFSYFLYFQLLLIEIKSNQISVFNQVETDHSVDEKRKGKHLEFYPGNLFVFKSSFKFIHEILSLFYTENQILTKSYRFLQFSIKISLFIPFVFVETQWLNQITIFTILLINCGIFPFIKMILKIFQSIYRFGGKWSISIIFLFCLIHFFCYLVFILQLKQYQKDIHEINLEISMILACSVFLFYVLVEPILAFSRIIIFKLVIVEIRKQQISPTYQLLYFFICHQKLDNLFQSYAIM